LASSNDGEGSRESEERRRDQDAPSEGWRHSSNEEPLFGTQLWRSGEVFMAKRKVRKDKAQIEERENNSGQTGSDSAGQSGDAQGLSQVADVDEESVGELAETDQVYEAEAVEGIEDAGNHPERPVRTHEDKGR
jgi:hypothetical protein